MHKGHITMCLFWGAAVFACGPIARAQSLDQQERCAQQAKRTFAELDAEHRADMKMAGSGTSLFTGDYQSHYNVKLGKCLMLIERLDTLGSQSSNRRFLIDANERRPYANYVWMGRETPPMACNLSPSLRENRFCNTRKEFDEFVAPYMEE